MREPSYSSMNDVLTYKTEYVYWCTSCKRGPFFTAGAKTECPVCGAYLALSRNADGDLDVVVESTKVKRL